MKDVSYLTVSRHRSRKEGLGYALSMAKPRARSDTLDYDVTVIEVPAHLDLRQATQYVVKDNDQQEADAPASWSDPLV